MFNLWDLSSHGNDIELTVFLYMETHHLNDPIQSQAPKRLHSRLTAMLVVDRIIESHWKQF